MDNIGRNEGGACKNQSTSVDLKLKCPNANSLSSMVDGSSVALKSLLGVNDYYPALNDAYQNQTMNFSNENVGSKSKEDEMSSELLKTPVETVLAPKTRGILRSSSVGNSSLSHCHIVTTSCDRKNHRSSRAKSKICPYCLDKIKVLEYV